MALHVFARSRVTGTREYASIHSVVEESQPDECYYLAAICHPRCGSWHPGGHIVWTCEVLMLPDARIGPATGGTRRKRSGRIPPPPGHREDELVPTTGLEVAVLGVSEGAAAVQDLLNSMPTGFPDWHFEPGRTGPARLRGSLLRSHDGDAAARETITIGAGVIATTGDRVLLS
jgi:hypothetical protein